LLLDADLAILGSSPDLYDAYAAAVRREYAWVSPSDWLSGRRRVLDSLLRRERIYRTASMPGAREETARLNLRRETEVLLAAEKSVTPMGETLRP
jgi:predicted metal-dependent HD superfamily phosphohydrolase